MELKHLNIAVIVANAAKAARSREANDTPALTGKMFEDVRPSDGASSSSGEVAKQALKT